MNNTQLHFESRKTKIYKDIYRPSTKVSRFVGTILSIIIQGHSPVNNADRYYTRKYR